MPGKPAHKYFSFQALTQAYFNHSAPIFIFSPVQSPREGPVVHSVALSCCYWSSSWIVSTFKYCFCLLNEEETHFFMWT